MDTITQRLPPAETSERYLDSQVIRARPFRHTTLLLPAGSHRNVKKGPPSPGSTVTARATLLTLRHVTLVGRIRYA